jgi:hypothetical protein
MHLERNATWGFAFGDRCFGPFCDSLQGGQLLVNNSTMPNVRMVLGAARA